MTASTPASSGASSATGSRAVVIVPTYNEVENLQQAVDAIRGAAPSVHILVVDDSRPDGTDELADRFAVADPQMNVADMLIGSRWVPGGDVVDWPAARRLLSRAGNAYARLALGISVKVATAGFRSYRAQVLRTLDLADVESRGYCFQIHVTRRLLEAMWRVTQWGSSPPSRRTGGRRGPARC